MSGRVPLLIRTQAQTIGSPARTAATNGFLISQTGSYPLAYPSSYDQVGWQAWEKVPLTISTVVAVEGVDFPFRSRIWLDNAQASWRKRWADRARAAQPRVQQIPLVLHAPADTTPLFTGKRDETPAAWAVWDKRRRYLVAATPPTWQWGGRLAAYLPATTYPDTACRMYSEIQRHLLESPINSGATWTLWTDEEVRGYLLQRLSRFVVDTGLIRERRDVTGVASREVSLPGDALEVLRTVWNTGGTRSVLIRADKWALDHGQVGWESLNATPVYYTEDTSSALGAEVTPTPTVPGTLELVIIAAPTLATRCASINLPAIFTPYIKYGVLADMLSKQTEAHDPQRAAYCESRYAEGLELAKLFFAGRV